MESTYFGEAAVCRFRDNGGNRLIDDEEEIAQDVEYAPRFAVARDSDNVRYLGHTTRLEPESAPANLCPDHDKLGNRSHRRLPTGADETARVGAGFERNACAPSTPASRQLPAEFLTLGLQVASNDLCICSSVGRHNLHTPLFSHVFRKKF